MQLGRSIIGAIIGAVIGIAVMIGIYLATSIDSAWLALPVAILTGLGVRMMVVTGGHASYLRGAITGALALGAYLIGWNAVATIAQQQASKLAQQTTVEAPAEDTAKDSATTDDDAAMEEETPEAAPAPPITRQASGKVVAPKAMPKNWSTLDFIVLCVSAFIAYEMGRGSAGKTVVEAEETVTEVPTGTHPDA